MSDTVIVTMLSRLADVLEIEIVAEGLETEDQREQLSELGCHYAQGYLFARAMPIEVFPAWLALPFALAFVSARVAISELEVIATSSAPLKLRSSSALLSSTTIFKARAMPTPTFPPAASPLAVVVTVFECVV